MGITVAVLVLVGIVMVFSSSAVYALEKYNDSYYFLKRQAVWCLLGTGVLLVVKRMDYRKLQQHTYPIMLATFLLLLAVMFPQVSKEVGGARRWLTLGGFSFQPSELAKFTLVLFIAKSLVKRADKLRDFAYGYLPNLVVLGFFFIPILFQPDFGTAVIICMVTFTMLFVAGLRKKFLFLSVLALIPFIASAILSAEYRTRRIIAFLDPWQDPSNAGFQAIQSFYAFGRGGYWGTGLGASHQKLFYLPEAHTDFIFSVIGEELGFLGTTAIVLLFSILIWRGFVTACRAKDPFGTHLATGLTLLIGFQAFINLGVTVGLLPTKGLTLPFISMGGSSMLITMLSVGILLNISEQTIKH
ncbi:MAG: putative lipid II flippase FtsW [Nitrospina sp.]|jgi:cell division protein FtsW|nr:putative lipid II flippase FtsW [Nitrospina sp.]MBT3413992.1 putative lipid II flippase FtsW [Nitrospina sp.]MBT3857694.1 putative lipid II flippase FtsW [Nitrospina sp.]MBT4103709.1 putative lipid II flippase FtsW [Nitrospina sp.]MBT4389303.1 putative lipid II flippase FtsW [Nitrospina sp.]